MFSDEEIACMAHQLNCAYNYLIGDPWIDLSWWIMPQWYRDAVIDGVRAARAGMTSRELHENWCSYYKALGWVYGPVKNPDASPPTHPNLVAYDELSAAQARKNDIFQLIVLGLAAI